MMEPSAEVFEVQRFSLHDGPGIRSLVFFKGCNLHCPWCQNPESQATKPVIAFHENRCEESFACVAVCPNDALRTDGFRIDQTRCEPCGLCVEACAHDALRTIGETLTPTELMKRIARDRPYYESSGGGVTFSGGEPTLHLRFLDAVLRRCQEAGIHTNLETSGTFMWEMWEATLVMLDLIYFDLKIMDADLHQRLLGPGYSRIIENAVTLASRGFPVEFRMALVPGYTDTKANIDAAIDFLHQMNRPQIHLLEYHNMGEAKLEMIGAHQPGLGLKRFSEEEWAELVRAFELGGIEVLKS